MRAAHLAMIGIMGAVALAGCSNRGEDPKPLHDLRNNSGRPNEFAIVPNKPLEIPEAMAALPTPTPGGANRTDQTPKADAVAALGGNPSRLQSEAGTVGAGDGALVQQAGRFGKDPAIRQTLAAEDEAVRRKGGRFTWAIVPRDDYAAAYRRQRLNPFQWLNVYRRAGAQTPSAPPGE